jgi:hypothetical protein
MAVAQRPPRPGRNRSDADVPAARNEPIAAPGVGSAADKDLHPHIQQYAAARSALSLELDELLAHGESKKSEIWRLALHVAFVARTLHDRDLLRRACSALKGVGDTTNGNYEKMVEGLREEPVVAAEKEGQVLCCFSIGRRAGDIPFINFSKLAPNVHPEVWHHSPDHKVADISLGHHAGYGIHSLCLDLGNRAEDWTSIMFGKQLCRFNGPMVECSGAYSNGVLLVSDDGVMQMLITQDGKRFAWALGKPGSRDVKVLKRDIDRRQSEELADEKLGSEKPPKLRGKRSFVV